MTINIHFHKYKADWDPELVSRLSDTIHRQSAVVNDRVSVLIYEANLPYNLTTYKVLGVFKTTLVANQMALDYFKTKFKDYLDCEREHEWPGIYELESPMGSAERNSIAWHLSSSAELTLKATPGFDGDKYCVYVQRQDVHLCCQPQMLEESDSEEDSAVEMEMRPELLPGIYRGYTDEECVYF